MSNMSKISIEAELPEELHSLVQAYLEEHSGWDIDRVIASAIALFLLQNGCSTIPGTSRNCRIAARYYSLKISNFAE